MRFLRHAPILVFFLAFALFAPSIAFRLVEWDDHLYLSASPMFAATSPSEAFRAAFSSFYEATYAPFLWCSYALDSVLFRASPASPWGFHLSNVLLHAANAALFCLLLSRFCKKRFLVFFCAAFWAFHPLRVESVAWIAERKDVLSGFFALLSVFAWLRFLRLSSSRLARSVAYGLSLLLFASALLVKSSTAPLPAVLLLLDVWPLRRIPFSSLSSALCAAARHIAEKIPFFALALASFALSTAAHVGKGALHSESLALRLGSVPVHAAFYLVKTALPLRLHPLYSNLPVTLPRLFLAIVFLAFLAVSAVRLRRRVPAFPLGLLVFFVFLVPVSGIVRFGIQSIADRFTYLPALGISVALAAIPLPGSPSRRRLLSILLLVLLAAFSAVTLRLLPAWRDHDTINARVLACQPSHPIVLADKASRLFHAGRLEEALPLAAAACQSFDPYSGVNARILHATLLQELGRPADAVPVLQSLPREAVNPSWLWPVDWELARVHYALERFEDACDDASRAIAEMLGEEHARRRPFLHLLAMAAAHRAGRPSEALDHARAFPAYAAKTSLSDADLLPFYLHEWIDHHRTLAAPFFRFLLASGDNPALVNNVVWGLATADRSPIPPGEILAAAVRLAQNLPAPDPGILDTLAAAQARAGRYFDAQASILQALALLDAAPPSSFLDIFAAQLRQRLDLYRKETPYSENAFARWLAASFGTGLPLAPTNP